jgi:Glycosyl transferase family 2
VIEAVGVAVPAHNEETLLPSCLTALRRAARQVSVPVHLLVAADSCTDRTAAVARACGALVIGIRARSVGAARAAGMRELLRLTAGRNPAAIWLATTDADTVVPPSWLQRQIAHADRDWDVVVGTISVADWNEHPPHVSAAFAARYDFGDRPHPHVHGANIGIRASAYLAAGGFRPLRTAEDHALLTAAAEAGCSVLSAGDVTVETSARRHARAPHGFSHLLRTLAPAPQPQLSGLTCKSTRPTDNHDYALVGQHRAPRFSTAVCPDAQEALCPQSLRRCFHARSAAMPRCGPRTAAISYACRELLAANHERLARRGWAAEPPPQTAPDPSWRQAAGPGWREPSFPVATAIPAMEGWQLVGVICSREVNLPLG